MITHTTIETEAARLADEVIALRRDFHRHPELGLEEMRTSSLISRYLLDLGLEVKTGIGGTGVIGLLKGSRPGKTVMLRADMDALPIQELNEVDYRSVNPGVMHACGHDGHMAVLLGTAKLLSRMRHSLSGRVKFVFQPAEENLGGARLMIEQGVLQDPQVDAAFGLHLISLLPTGYIGCREGAFMASIDIFTIRVFGRAGHSALPVGSVDAISLSAEVVLNLQNHIKGILPEDCPIVVNIGTFHGGTAPNIVTDRVELTGTVRALDEGVRSSIKGLMDEFLRKTVIDNSGTYELEYAQGYPVTVNDEAMTAFVRRIAADIVDSSHVIDMPPAMASEDMSFYLKEVPGCFFFVGAGGTDPVTAQTHHNPHFFIDEQALDLGVRMMASIAADFLNTA
ncbi:MAG TPA: amidohydrolase [Desulfomonilia bacterium]|nr:amidohydrolase [Desulfomonilia bacterium]